MSVVDPKTDQVLTDWQIPGGGSPGHGRRVGRRHEAVAVGSLRHRGLRLRHGHRASSSGSIPVDPSPHGLAVWPQPGRYSASATPATPADGGRVILAA